MKYIVNFEEFDNYVSGYDMNDSMIDLKYHHTYRVVEYSKKIGESLKLDEHDQFLVETIGLLHDIARFKQAKEYHTFKDFESFDHGNVGCDILLENDYIFKFVETEEDKNIVLTAIRLHNKKYLEEDLTDREKLFCKVIRDADKIDIMDKFGNEIKDGSTRFNEKAFEEVMNKQLITYTSIDNGATDTLKTLAYIFDLNFKKSFEEIKELDILNRKISYMKEHVDIDQITKVENVLNEFIENKINTL